MSSLTGEMFVDAIKLEISEVDWRESSRDLETELLLGF